MKKKPVKSEDALAGFWPVIVFLDGLDGKGELLTRPGANQDTKKTKEDVLKLLPSS